MKLRTYAYISGALLCLFLLSACRKDWLDAKPNKSLVVPATPADYQALLDDPQLNLNQPSLTQVGDGDYYVSDTRYAALGADEQNAYIWAPTTDNFYGGGSSPDWVAAFSSILNANVVLDGLANIKPQPSSAAAFNNVKGSALFYRSFNFYCLSQEFCKPYDSATSATDLGLPLRTSSNVNLSLKRASLEETYNQIITDLLTAKQLLPEKPLFPTRPSRAAVFGLLSRVYLAQQKYDKALVCADSCLRIQSELLDYNQLNAGASHPIPLFSAEVIYQSTLGTYFSFLTSRLIVDSTLYRMYNVNDLRLQIYFTTSGGNKTFKGSYTGTRNFFGGLATDEIYLTRAECNARAGNVSAALGDFNKLLKNRWTTGTYTDMVTANADTALTWILRERRKELCYRNLRWTDLRRLNTEAQFQTAITRVVNGQTYTLPPNSPRYVLPLDPVETGLGGLQQNPR